MNEVELDLNYALGELTNIQSELEQYFGKGPGNLPERLEGIEARLKELQDTLLNYFSSDAAITAAYRANDAYRVNAAYRAFDRLSGTE